MLIKVNLIQVKFDILLSKKELFLITRRDVVFWFPINLRLVSLRIGDRGDAYIFWLTWLGQPLLDWRGITLGDSPSWSPLCLNARFVSSHSGNRQGNRTEKQIFQFPETLSYEGLWASLEALMPSHWVRAIQVLGFFVQMLPWDKSPEAEL